MWRGISDRASAEQSAIEAEEETVLVRRGNVKRKRIIVYWEFVIDIFGPCCKDKAERRRIRRILSRKRLQQLEEAALLATKAKLPPGFTARLS